MTLQQFWLIALGGSAGALARYLIGTFIQQRIAGQFPWGTFVINATGSIIIGLVMGLATRGLVSANVRFLVVTGFVGAYTTFSTFEYESMQLGSSWKALGNLLGSVVVGYGCVWLGAGANLLSEAAARFPKTH